MDTDVSPLQGCVLPPVYTRSGEVGGAMETADSTLTRQIQAVDRSMVFLRQEHLTLLHGLHMEILSLQKRCSELTTEYEVKPPGRSQIELQEEEELLEVRCREVELRLAEQHCVLGEMRKELGHKGSLVGALRATLKEKERRFLEELKRRSHRSTALHSELQRQTESAACLSFQLHAARQKLHQQRMLQRQGLLLARGGGGGGGGGGVRGGRGGSPHEYGGAGTGGSITPQWLSPAASSPPSASSPVAVKPKRRSGAAARSSSPGHHHNHHHHLHLLLRPERSRECVPVERVTGPAEPTAMPDPALFLHPAAGGRRLQQQGPRAARSARHHHRRHPGPPPGGEDGEEGGGEGPVTPQDGGGAGAGAAPRLVSATAAVAAAGGAATEAQAD